MLSFGWARTLIARDSNCLLSSESEEMPISILAGTEGIVFEE